MALFFTVLRPKPAFFIFVRPNFFMCFSFWYYIYEVKDSSLQTIQLHVNKELLLNMREKNTTAWMEARAFLGNRPAGTKVSH